MVRPYQLEHDFAERDKRPTQKIVTQGKYECGAAALAMATGHTLFNVKRALGRHGWRNDNYGLGSRPSIAAARDLGFDLLYVPSRVMYKFDELPTAVLTVPSLNYKGRWHAVTWLNGEMLDPNWDHGQRKTYGREWNPFTIGASGAEILLKPMPRIQYEDLITMMLNKDNDLGLAIKECAA
jgi:ABC-type bacteriocin/lantibiotic exporter with double-glycine peptidase domain